MAFLWTSLGLGVIAGLANVFGGAIVSARAWSRTFLAYFIALGAGFMLATALTQMVPESMRLAPLRAPILILAGYFIVHFFEHSWLAHFHFGEETHVDEFLNPRVAYVALSGDLIPEVNRTPGPKIALTVAAGVGLVILLRLLLFPKLLP